MNTARTAQGVGLRIATPLGPLDLLVRGGSVTCAWFAAGDATAPTLPTDAEDSTACHQGARWFGAYFAQQQADANGLAVQLAGTELQRKVWAALRTLPYGQTTTYGVLTAMLGLSPQHIRAVAGAVGRNPVAIVVPCHRVLGADGSLTGYAGGLDRKRALLAFERDGIFANVQLGLPLFG